MECARHGARGLILHYFGDDATTNEVRTLKTEIESAYVNCKAVCVPGDIAVRETSLKVCFPKCITTEALAVVLIWYHRLLRRASKRSAE